MKHISIVLLIVMVSMASCTINKEKEMAKDIKPSSFQPKPLDDEWSKWLVGEWEGTVGLDGMKSEAWREIEFGLNGQFLITKHEHKVTNEEIQEIKKITHISDEDVKKYQSLPFKYLEIWTIDPKNGEVVGYFFDSMRRIAEGKGKLKGNKEIVEWQWFAQGQGASIMRNISITERISDDRFITTKKYILPDGSTMEGKVEMTRKKKRLKSKSKLFQIGESSMSEIFLELIRNLPEADIPLSGIKAYLFQAENHQILFMEFSEDVEVPEHSHEAQWGVVLDGDSELIIGGKLHVLKKGDTYFIPKGVPHSANVKAGHKDVTLFNQKDRYSILRK